MEESEARLFLERNRSAVVNGVREVKRLVDFLMEKKYLLGEMPNEILTQGTKQDQMRELYRHLNTNIGFKLTLEWLRVNEPDLIEDLEKNSDADHAEPARKRPRSSAEAMDETDSDPNMPNLRCLSTLHKLEKWVSAPKNSKELIGMLNSKLAKGEMDNLEKQLMNKKLKKGLCFSAKDIKDIYSNQKLQSYFDTPKDAKFPDLPLKLFFEKDKGLALTVDDDEDDDDDVITDSAYGSSYSASYSSNLSLFSKHLSQSEDQLQSDDLATTYESTDLRDALRNVKKTTDSKSQVSPEEILSKQPQIHHAAQGQSATHAQIQQTPNTQFVQEVLKIGTFTTEPFQPSTLNVPGDCLIQSEGPQMNHDPDSYAKFKVTDMPSQKECREIVFSKQRQELPDAHCQNGSLVQMPHADRDGTLLEEPMNTQDVLDEPNTQSARKMLTGKPGEGPLPFTSLQVAADDPVPSEGPWADGDNAQLDKPLNLQESEPNKQRDPEMANSEPLVGNDCVGVVVDCVMQGGVQQMICDPDPFTEFEGTGMASQKECRGFDNLKQKQELPDAHCQNGSLVQMPHADRDGTLLEEPMNTQDVLDEPNTQSARKMLTGKPGEGPLPFTSLQVAADDPVPSEGPWADGDNAQLDKPLNLQESEPNKQRDPEMANSEPLVGNDCVGVVVDCVMQGGVQQMICDPDPFTEFEGTGMASQKECRGFDNLKQKQELPDAHCQNGSLVQMPHADRDGTLLEEPMNTQDVLDEPNTQSARKMLTGKPGEGPLPFTSLQVAADDPVPSEGPWADGDNAQLDKPLNLQESEPNKQRDPEMANSEPFVGNDCVGVVVDCVMQGGVQQMICDPDPFTEFEGTGMASQKECRGFDNLKQKQELPDTHCQNGSLVQMPHADRDGTLLEEPMNTQDVLDEPNTQSARKMLTGKPGEGPLPFTSLQVAADDPVPSEGPWADGDNAQLDKPLNLQESEPNKQRDPEMANSEPLVGNDCVGVVVDCVMQGGVQQMICDPDPFTEFEGTGMASQKECRGFDNLKQKQELPDAHCQNGSLVQMPHADRDGTLLEEPMNTQDVLDEPNTQSARKMLTGKPGEGPLPFTSLQVAADDPVPSEGPWADGDNAQLDKPFNLQESEPNKQRDPEMANSEPLVGNDCVGVVVDCVMQGGVQQMICDPDPFTEFEGTGMASQKECRGFDNLKQKQELPDTHCQNGSLVQMPHADRDGTLLEEPMNTQDVLDEPNTQSARKMLTGKPGKGPLPFTSLQVAADDPVPSEGPWADGDNAQLDKPLNLQESEPNKQRDPEMANSEPLVGNDCVGVVVDCVMQGGVQQMICDPDPFTEFEGTGMASQKECRGFDNLKQKQELPDAHCQNGSLVQMPHADRDGTLLEEPMNTQDVLDQPNTQSARKMLTGKPGEGPLPFTSLQVAADDAMQSEGPWPDGDNAQLDKPLNLQESEPSKQCDPEMANSEPLVGNDCVGVVVDCVMQGGVQQMNCDPDPFTEFEGTGMASQKECRGFDNLKQKQELPDAHCQNGSLVQMQHADKDGTLLEEPMNTQEMLNEPSTQSNKEMLFGKPCAPEPLLCTSLRVAPDDPVQSEGPEGPREKSSSQSITTHSDKTNMPLQKSIFPKQTRDFHGALRPDGDDPLLDKNEANIQFAKMVNNEPDPGSLGVATYSLLQSKGPHIDTKEGSEADALIQNKDSEAPTQDQTVNASHTLQGQEVNRPGLMCMSEAVKNQLKAKRRKQQNKRKLNKINDKGRLLYEWAKKKCPGGSDEEVKKVFNCISFENHVEHNEYPCFNTENVMVYTDPQTGERQIIVTDDKNSAAKNNLPKEIKILLNYQMWVCGIAKAVLINQKEREVQFDLQFLEGIKNHCEKFVFKALAPALAVFKNLQRQERLYSVIQKH